MKKFISLNQYNKSELIFSREYPLERKELSQDISITQMSQTEKDGSVKIHAVFTAKRACRHAGISMIFETDDHVLSDYIFAPAALYNGNRFYSVRREYAPMYKAADLEMCKKGPVITDVPRLYPDGTGRAQLNTGDLTAPCAGYFSEDLKKGVLPFW